MLIKKTYNIKYTIELPITIQVVANSLDEAYLKMERFLNNYIHKKYGSDAEIIGINTSPYYDKISAEIDEEKDRNIIR